MIVTISIILGIMYAYLAWHKMKFACAGLLLLLPSYLVRFSIFGVPMTFLELLILILFIVWLIREYRVNHKVFKNKKEYCKFIFSYVTGYYYKSFKTQLKKSTFTDYYLKIQKPILIFLLAGIISLFVAPNTIAAAGIFKAYIFEPLLVLIVFLNQLKSREDFYYYLEVLSIGVAFISLYGLLQYFTQTGLLIETYAEGTFTRITSFFEYPNAIGLFILPIIGLLTPYVFQLLFNQKHRNVKKGIILSLVIILGLSAMILSRTEAALVAYVAVFFIYLLWFHWSSRLLAIFAAIGVGAMFFIHPLVFQKVQDKLLLQDFSGQIRLHTYGETWTMLQDHLIFGAGLSGYQESMIAYHQDVIWIGKILQPVEIYLYPHNIFLNVWSELGILGVIFFTILIFWLLYQLYRRYFSEESIIVLFGLSVLLIHGLVDVPFFKNDLAILFWLIIGFALFAIQINNAKKKKV